MKKILLSLLTMLVTVASFAQTTLDFSSASAWGNYANPEAGAFTQVENGDVLTNGNFKIAVSFASGNGARFFAHSTSGAINFRLYVGTTITLSTVDGSNMTAVEIGGSNLGSTYVSDFDGYNNGTWKGSASSITLKVIKSTVQINTMKIYAGESGPASIANTPETAYTVTKALELIDAGEDLNTEVYVKGTITKVTEVSTSYGNATYDITDGTKSMTVYRGFGLEGNKFTSEDDIQDGDEVIVYGKLKKYKETYEVDSNNKLYSLNGKTKADAEPSVEPTDPETPETPDTPETPYTVVGAGTLDNPYTTEDIIKGIYKDGETITGVWVKGTILGCFNSAATPIDESKEAVQSNIALGNADGTNIIPVALVASKDNISVPRQDLNLVDHADLKGKEVWVYGDITKYFTVAGMKNTSDYSLDGKTTNINSINATSAAKKIFNISGQQLQKTQRGINIVDGKKVMVK